MKIDPTNGFLSLFLADVAALKVDMRRVVRAEHSGHESVYYEICRLVRDSGIYLNAKQFAYQVAKLVVANNPDRADKLIGVLDDWAFRRWVWFAGAGLVGFGVIVCFIVAGMQ